MAPHSVSLDVLGPLINVLGIATPTLFSASVAWIYRERFFRYWTLSYLFVFFLIGLLFLSEAVKHAWYVDLLLVAVFTIHTVYILKTAYALIEQELPRHARVITAIAAGTSVLAVALQAPIAVVGVIQTLFGAWAHWVLGTTLIRFNGPSQPLTRTWLGVAVIASGLWAFSYPFFQSAGLMWLGYVVAGVFHLVLGVGMMVFLLEHVAIRLRQQNEELQEVDRLKTEFIATVSHELRTPLTVIKGSASIIEDGLVGPLTTDQGRLMKAIGTQVEGLTRLINDVLDFSKMEGGSMPYAFAPDDLVQVVRNAEVTFTSLAAEKAITLTTEVPDNELVVTMDQHKIYQVVSNLLANALKFTPNGGRIRVRLSEQNGLARLEVSDSGIGVASEYREKIFTKFFQVDNSSTRRFGGAGLGLAISKGIVVDGHGGRIWAEASEDGGTAIHVELPVQRAVSPADGSARVPHTRPLGLVKSTGP